MTKRIEYIDLAKGFCIILVVAFHIVIAYGESFPISNFFKAFRMPLYFFLSGFFFKTYEGFICFLKRKINKLLIPFVFYYLSLSVALSLVLHHFCGITLERAENFTLVSALTEFFTREEFLNSPIWFLLCLFEINVLFYVIYSITKFWQGNVKMLICLSLMVGFIGMGLSYGKINIPGFIDSSLTALPFFCFGYIINRHTNLLLPNQWDKYDWLFIIAAFAFVYLFCGYLDYKQNKLSNIAFLTAYPCGLIGTMAVIFLAKKIKHIPVISYWGRFSIIILVTHRMVYQMYEPIISYCGLYGWSAILVNLTVTMFSYFAIIPFIRRFLPYVTAQKDLIKIK